MPQLRKDPITDNWVIIAEERSKRPHDFGTSGGEKPKVSESCPFCYGNEDITDIEVFAIRPPESQGDTSGWQVRVIPNKYPAVINQGEIIEEANGIFEAKTAWGYHEVLIEAPEHNSHLGQQSIDHVSNLVEAFYHRFHSLMENPKTKYVQIFKNSGQIAGASLEHPHWQIISIPVIPPVIHRELTIANKYYQEKKQCLFCAVFLGELENKGRIVEENEDFLIFCPYAARFPYETWIVPKKHQHCFGLIGEKEKVNLALALKSLIGKLERAFDFPPYNIVLHTAPKDEECQASYHWHLEILPRLSNAAGFEWGTGCSINSVAPEQAAEILRNQK